MGVGGTRAAELDRPPLAHRVENGERAVREAVEVGRRRRRGQVDEPVPGESRQRGSERFERAPLGDEEGPVGTVRRTGRAGARGRRQSLEQDLGADPGGIALGEREDGPGGGGRAQELGS